MAPCLLYHGTAHRFARFSLDSAGIETNATLGIHLTESIKLAAHYAKLSAEDHRHLTPLILVVQATITNPLIVRSEYAYLRLNRESRADLIRAGHDAVKAETGSTDLAGCWCVFDPKAIKILTARSITLTDKMFA